MIQKMQKMMSRKNKKGFTLIELIVVIAILAILAAIAIPRFSGTLNNSKRRADDANERIVVSAVQLYKAENNNANPPNLTVADLDPEYLDGTALKWSNGSAITAYTIDGTTGDVTVTGKPVIP